MPTPKLESRTMSSPPPSSNTTNMSCTHTTSTTGPIWAELAAITLQAFTPDLINRLQSFIANTPSFDTATHIPLLATLVIRHVTLSLKESTLPKSRSFRDVAYHAVMSNKILTKRERSIVRAVSVSRVGRKEEPVLRSVSGVPERRTGNVEMFPRAGGKDCLQSASMRRLLMANQSPLEIPLLQTPRKKDGKNIDRGDTRKRERKRASIRYAPTRNHENRDFRRRQSQFCEDTSVAKESDTDATGEHVAEKRSDTLREPRVKRERPSRLVQLRRQRLERRKASVT